MSKDFVLHYYFFLLVIISDLSKQAETPLAANKNSSTVYVALFSLILRLLLEKIFVETKKSNFSKSNYENVEKEYGSIDSKNKSYAKNKNF